MYERNLGQVPEGFYVTPVLDIKSTFYYKKVLYSQISIVPRFRTLLMSRSTHMG